MYFPVGRSRTAVWTGLFAILAYWILLKKRRYTETFDYTAESTEPKIIWEFISDFKNLMRLNPTM